MSDPIQKSTQKANKLADFLSGWSRTSQALIGLVSSIAIILGSIFTFAKQHAAHLMDEAVERVSDRIEQKVSVASGKDSLIYERAEELAFKVIVRLDSVTHVTNRLDNDIQVIKDDQYRTDEKFDMIWRKLNEIPEPSPEKLEMDSLRQEIRESQRIARENRRIDSLHQESMRKAVEQLNQIKTGDRTP